MVAIAIDKTPLDILFSRPRPNTGPLALGPFRVDHTYRYKQANGHKRKIRVVQIILGKWGSNAELLIEYLDNHTRGYVDPAILAKHLA